MSRPISRPRSRPGSTASSRGSRRRVPSRASRPSTATSTASTTTLLPNGRPMSRETESLLATMIDSSNLSAAQRRRLRESVKENGVLPTSLDRGYHSRNNKEDNDTDDTPSKRVAVSDRPRIRTRDDILASNPYEVDKFVPSAPKMNTGPDEKARYQSALFRNGLPKKKKAKGAAKGGLLSKPGRRRRKRMAEERARAAETPVEPVPDRFDEVYSALMERLDFLREMRDLGMAAKYEPVIVPQVVAKLNALEEIDPVRAEAAGTAELRDLISGPKSTTTLVPDELPEN